MNALHTLRQLLAAEVYGSTGDRPLTTKMLLELIDEAIDTDESEDELRRDEENGEWKRWS